MIRNVIADGDPYLRRRNSEHRFKIRRIKKNRFPVKRSCVICGDSFLCKGIEEYVQRQYYLGPDKDGNVRHVCWGCDLKDKVRIAAGTLYHLINALPQVEHDWQEIFRADFRHALIPLPQQTNFGWRRFEEWLREGVVLCGMSAKSATGQDSQWLRDYSEGTRLLTKFGKHEFAYRQKAASPVRDCEKLIGLWPLHQLKTLDEQSTLRRLGRLYKNSCWWPKKGPHRLFDKAEASSWKKAQLWKPGQPHH